MYYLFCLNRDRPGLVYFDEDYYSPGIRWGFKEFAPEGTRKHGAKFLLTQDGKPTELWVIWERNRVISSHLSEEALNTLEPEISGNGMPFSDWYNPNPKPIRARYADQLPGFLRREPLLWASAGTDLVTCDPAKAMEAKVYKLSQRTIEVDGVTYNVQTIDRYQYVYDLQWRILGVFYCTRCKTDAPTTRGWPHKYKEVRKFGVMQVRNSAERVPWNKRMLYTGPMKKPANADSWKGAVRRLLELQATQ